MGRKGQNEGKHTGSKVCTTCSNEIGSYMFVLCKYKGVVDQLNAKDLLTKSVFVLFCCFLLSLNYSHVHSQTAYITFSFEVELF